MQIKYSLPVTDLRAVVSKAAKAVPARSNLTILESVLMSITETELTVTGSDLTHTVTARCGVKGKTDYAVCVPAARFLRVLSMFSEGEAVLTFTEGRVSIQFGRGAAYKFPTSEGAEYPAIKTLDNPKEAKVSADTLADLIDHTLYAVSTDELRPAMMGVLVRTQDNAMTWVATDGHRLAEYSHNGMKCAKGGELIIPAKSLAVVRGLFPTGDVTVTYSDQFVRFESGGVMFMSRLIDEQYPNYESVIPDGGKNVLTVPRKEMLSALQRIALTAHSQTHQVIVHLGDEVKLTSEDADAGNEGVETVEGKYDGTKLSMGFNGEYLVDCLKNVLAETVTFTIDAPTRAVVVTGDEQLRALVMPVRIGG